MDDEHAITAIFGRVAIDGHEIPWPERFSYNPDTNETTLTYKGIPRWITQPAGGGGVDRAEAKGSGGGGGNWRGSEWTITPYST